MEPHERLPQILDRPVLDWVDGPEDWEARIFQCLHPEMAQSLLFYGIVHDQEESYIPSQGELDCLKELTAATDAAEVFAGMASEPTDPQDTGTAVKFIAGVFLCVPDWFIASSEMDASDIQKECLRDLILDLDADLVGAMLTADEYGDAELDAIMEFWNVWDACMSRHDDAAETPPTPSPATPMPATATPVPMAPPLSDDHPDFLADATVIDVGQETAGILEFEGDVDYFVFQATEGEIYRIETALGTLEQSTLEMYDAFGVIFLSSADYGGPPAARLDWQAYQPGLYYVAASGRGTGSYSLKVATVADDHGDYSEMATPLNIGETAGGRIDHSSDIDFFVFYADQGRSYRIAIEVGSLRGTWIELLDVDRDLGYSDYYRDVRAVRIDWVAPDTGSYWLAVGARSPGAYGVEVKALPAKQ